MSIVFNPFTGTFDFKGDMVIGAPVINGTDNRIPFINGSPAVLSQDDALQFDNSIDRLTLGTGEEFLTTNDTHLLSSNEITSVGTSISPFDIIKLANVQNAIFNPSSNTNSGIGATLYSSGGMRGKRTGNKNFNGGVPFGSILEAFSILGAFGLVEDNGTGGTLDGAAGILFTSTHGGYGSAADLLVGGVFDANTTDDAELGTPTGSVTTAIGGLFSSGASGVDLTNAISGKFLEPLAYDPETGAGIPTITNQTAAWVDGTLSISRSDVATAASITDMAVASSFIKMTGSTATDLHGIHADTFSKIITLYNVSSATVTLKNQSATETTAANRIICNTGADVAVLSGKSAILQYDTAQSRWIHLLNS